MNSQPEIDEIPKFLRIHSKSSKTDELTKLCRDSQAPAAEIFDGVEEPQNQDKNLRVILNPFQIMGFDVAYKKTDESIEILIDPFEIGMTDFRMILVELLGIPSAHKMFVEMPSRKVGVVTELVDGESPTSNNMECIVVLWHYDRGKPKLSVEAEDESHLNMEGVFYYCQELIGQRLIFMPYDEGKKSLMPSCEKVRIDSANCMVEDGILVFDPGGVYPAPTKRRKQCTVESSCVVGIIDAYRVLGCILIFDPGGELASTSLEAGALCCGREK